MRLIVGIVNGGVPEVTVADPIRVKFVPSRLYANWLLTPGDAAKLDVPFKPASMAERLVLNPDAAVSVI